MSTAATLAEARRRLLFTEQLLATLQRGDELLPERDREDVYRSALLQACATIGYVTDARTEEGAARLWRDLQPDATRVYLCAAFSRQREMLTYAAVLGGLGLRVVARWLSASPDDQTNTVLMRAAAVECCEDLAQVDQVIAFSEPHGSGYWTGGRHVEVGYALALRRPVILVGPVENVFHAHPGVTQVGTFAEALALLGVSNPLRLRAFADALDTVEELGAVS